MRYARIGRRSATVGAVATAPSGSSRVPARPSARPSTRAPVRIPPERLTAWRTFLEAHAVVVGALEAELLEARDLPLAWYDVLVALSEAPERRLRMQELADRVVFSRSGLTRLVDRMAGAGLVARAPCPDDRRGTFAVLTPAGLTTLRSASGVHLRGVREHFDRHLGDAEVATLVAAFARVVAAARGADAAQGM